MNREETSRILALFYAQWPNHQRDAKDFDYEVQITAYQLGLSDVSYADAEIAAASCLRECKFFPVVAEIRERLPRTPGLDSTLYREFGALHGKPRTADEQRRYAAVCRRLGIDVPSGPIDRAPIGDVPALVEAS